NIVETMGEGYGKNYFLTDQMESNMNEMERIADKSGVEL
ncbi:MAG: ArsR family transcriptional regulator, partial [Nanohaloarchaea archaeon]|nr:ArsR family transcriptional regulator [Candidatus Nanohaloarchaea archaeon]